MERTSRSHLIAVIFALFFALSSFASPLGTTYQARIVKPDGLALESANVNFKFTILNPAATCILYSETFSAINMANSGGMISFALGAGVKTYPASSTTFAEVFNNSTALLSCDAGGPVSYSPAATDIRKIVMQFNDGNGWQTLPAMAINAVPYAIYSNDSLSLGGVSATSYIQYSTIPTCATSEALRYNGTSFNCVSVAGGGGGASYTVTSSDVTSALGYTPANQSSVATSFTTVTNSLSTVGTSFTTVTSTINSLGSSVTAIASTVSGLSASLAALTSSQWQANSSDIYYSSGRVGVSTSAPATKFAVGDSLTKPSAILQNVTSATTAEFNAIQTLTSGQTGAVTINSVAMPATNSTAIDVGLTTDLRVEASQTANVGSRVGMLSLNTHSGTGAVAEMYGQFNVIRNANGGTVSGMGGQASVVQNVSGTASNIFGEMLNVMNLASGNSSLMNGSVGSLQNLGTVGNMTGLDYTVTNSKQVTNLYGAALRLTNEASATDVYGVYSEVKNTVNSVANAQNIYGLYSQIQNHSNATVANVYGLYLEKYMTTAATVNDYGIYQRDASKNYFAGRIGIGTSSPVTALDVTGGIRVGTESATCAVSYAGTLRYVASNVEYCNGTAWQAFGVGGATTSSSIISALGYTPANSATVAVSLTAVTNSVATNASSITVLTSTVNTHTSSLAALTASMSAVTSSQWVTSGTNIYYNSGNVGIGTASPLSKLHFSTLSNPITSDTTFIRIDSADGVVGGEATFKMGYCLDSSGGISALCFDSLDPMGAGSQYVFKGQTPTQNIKFDNGFIGVGTEPSFALDIANSNSFQARILHASNNANDDAAIMMVRQRGTTASGSAVLNNDSIGGMYFRAHDGTSTNTSNAHIEVAAGENQSVTNRGNVMTFATTQNGQSARQEIMRIHSNGFVGIGNSNPNGLLTVGPSGAQNTNYNVYVASYKNNAGQGQYVGNWISSDYWALGPATSAADKTLRLGIASDRTGTWSGTQDLNLAVGGNVNVGGNLSVSGTIKTSEDLIPANTVVLMDSCPADWTDIGASGVGPSTVTCNGINCRMCQTPSAALVPPNKYILMESCPAGWTFVSQANGPGSAGYLVGGSLSVPFASCLSPSTYSVMPKGARLIAQTCPVEWKDVAATGNGQFLAGCPSTACRVCETPSAMSNVRLVYGGEASGTTYGGNATIVGGKGTNGGSVNVRGGNSENGFAGSVFITGGTASSTSGIAYSGGSVSITGGNGVLGGDGGSVNLQAGYNPASGTYNRLTLNSGGGFVGVNTGTPEGRFEVHGSSFVGNTMATNVSQFASGGVRLSYNNGGDYSDAITFAHIGNNGPGTAIGFRKSNYDSFIDFYTNSNTNVVQGGMAHAVTISNLGYLGIGTSAPTKLLHLEKSQNADTAILVRNASSGAAAMSALDVESDTNGIQLVSYGSGMSGTWGGGTIPKANSAVLRTYATLPVSHMGVGTGSAAPLYLITSDSPRVTINSTGLVGIGTVSPTTNLHVANTSTVTNAVATLESSGAGGRPYLKFRAENTDYGYVGFGSTGNATMALMNYQAGPLYLGASATARLVIDSTGSVAVGGIFSPAGQMANTSINLGDGGTIAATGGSGIGPGGLSWQATAGGYTGNFFNSGSASNANGLQVYTASVDAATYILNVRSNGSSRMVVKGDGRVGIGNASPAAALDVTGDIRGTGTVATWSDQRAKKNIEVIPDSLNRILKLRGVNFDWKTEEFPDKKFKTTRDMGVIAQEVEKVFPEVVNTSSDSFKSVSYSLLVAPLIEAVKEIYHKITGVEREVASLKAENAELKQRLERLEKQMLEKQKNK